MDWREGESEAEGLCERTAEAPQGRGHPIRWEEVHAAYHAPAKGESQPSVHGEDAEDRHECGKDLSDEIGDEGREAGIQGNLFRACLMKKLKYIENR